ncbi:MAG TPA: DUF5908 family protein [Kofleriaceae bacterium]|nr:DUF5908 family protein [Kofleriaceae bacterium]
MPIEIHELVIRAVVDPPNARPPGEPLDPQALQQLKNDIVAACLERVRDELISKTSR